MARLTFSKEFDSVEDTSRGNPFDLKCTRGDEILYVEVKGTSSAGEAIQVTRGEVEFNRTNKNRMALFLLQGIEVIESEGQTYARGGTVYIKGPPWKIEPADLIPICYTLKIR